MPNGKDNTKEKVGQAIANLLVKRIAEEERSLGITLITFESLTEKVNAIAELASIREMPTEDELWFAVGYNQLDHQFNALQKFHSISTKPNHNAKR